MQTYAKKRIEIITEAILESRFEQLLNEFSVTGYTVLPAIGGRGHDGVWRREGQVGASGQMIVVLCIVDPSRSEDVVEAIYGLIVDRIGIVSVSDVSVIRSDHF
ncbi:MAG: hypothetical protein VW835_19660 [Rickettsiales bacterium]